VYLLNLFCMLSSTQPCWYIFSSWPYSDFTPLSRSVTCTFLASPFLHQRCFWDRITVLQEQYDTTQFSNKVHTIAHVYRVLIRIVLSYHVLCYNPTCTTNIQQLLASIKHIQQYKTYFITVTHSTCCDKALIWWT